MTSLNKNQSSWQLDQVQFLLSSQGSDRVVLTTLANITSKVEAVK